MGSLTNYPPSQKNNLQISPTPQAPADTTPEELDLNHQKRTTAWIIKGLLVLAIIGVAGYLFYSGFFTKDILAKTVEAASKIQSYSQEITTKIEKDGQTAVSNGNIEVDVLSETARATFEISTEQLKITSESIIIEDDVFVKINIDNPLLKQLLSFPNDWIQFDINEVPQEYKDMIEDSLKFNDSLFLFREARGYLTITEEYGEEQLNGNTVIHYTLSLSLDFPNTVSQQNTKNFFEELANKGTIDVWVDNNNFYIQKIQFTTPAFTSTAEIKNINQVVNIQRPIRSLSYQEWKNKQFFASLPKTKIDEVVLYVSTDVSDKDVTVIQKAIREEIGVKTTLKASTTITPKTVPLYNSQREQFDGDLVWEKTHAQLQSYGPTKRFLSVVNIDLFTRIQEERPYIFSRALPNINTAIISLYRVTKLSDSSDEQAPRDLVEQRIKKLTLRTLGVSTGLSLSSASNNQSCLMYPAHILSELDKKGMSFCTPVIEALQKVFDIK